MSSPELARIVIIGAGGHGREFLGVIEAINQVRPTWLAQGFVDDGPPDAALLEALGTAHLGSSAVLEGLAGWFVIGIGDPDARRSVDAAATGAGLKAATLVHPGSTVGLDVSLGGGCVVMAGARITTNVTVGRHVHINQNATVAHDCVLGDLVTVSPGVNVSGNVTLEEGVTLGTGAAVIQGVRIGAGAMIGAGAVVIDDVPPGVTAAGVPARPLR